MFKLGFIGTGNMADAMISGVITGGALKPEEIIGTDISPERCQKIKKKYGICISSDNTEAAKASEMLVLSVKPSYYARIIEEIKGYVGMEQVMLTIAPGITLEWTEKSFGKQIKVIRAMPNTPACVGKGMTAVCRNKRVTPRDMETAMYYLSTFGRVEEVKEHLMDSVTAVSGSSPAYVFLFIEALADGAVKEGMPRDQAYRFASQAVLGSAEMVLKLETHPAILKDQVCSPGGTTIEAVCMLEKAGMRSAIIEAVRNCVLKSRQMLSQPMKSSE